MVDMHLPDLFGPDRGRLVAFQAPDVVQEALHDVRTHLGMEIAYLSEMVGDKTVFRAVDAPGYEHLVKPGDAKPLTEVYCKHILDGDLPELIPDTADHALALGLPITRALPIGAHISVPIHRRDGSVYGMFCCLSPKANSGLNLRDLNIMRMFARLAQAEVQDGMEARQIAEEAESRVREVMNNRHFRMVFQPIFDLASNEVSGFEALCRFNADPKRSPDMWFDEAAAIGLGLELELCVLKATLAVLPILPEPLYLSVNAGPDLVATGHLAALFADHTPERIVLEVTEHAAVNDAASFARALDALRQIGVRIAVDDAGAGYSGLQQIVRLRPEMIKLDRSLVSGIDQDPVLRTLCAALMHYTTETGAVLVAEGIETETEAAALRDLGVHRGQGWLLGKPMPLDEALAIARRIRGPGASDRLRVAPGGLWRGCPVALLVIGWMQKDCFLRLSGSDG
ncbi:sensor domain-containing phosphodiesterase [Gymnodinialimonas ulvae]|uniref:sensor domain-containing phosphodiesterase n=1 Tax=Gymnodinialimonas ulvae TaxID=3126504 RepID=UPI0030AFD386